MIFFIKGWDITSSDVIAAIRNFHDHEVFKKSFNATFVTLTPKKVGAVELNDFRPIGLIGSVYKITTKLLAERLKKVIHRLVDGQQMAFIKGRHHGCYTHSK